MHKGVDSIIVGQGLAGSLLALTLSHAGQRIIVIDLGGDASASQVSAGLINPISGRRLVLKENFHDLRDCARSVYGRIEHQLDIPVFTSLEQLKIFNDPDQASRWNRRLESKSYRDLVDSPQTMPDWHSHITSPSGTCAIRGSAVVDVRRLLHATRKWLVEAGTMMEEKFEYAELTPGSDAVTYRNIQARNVIFCEGVHALHNPWFPGLPLQPSCGELLTIRMAINIDALLNWGYWLLPLSNDTYRLGATNDWELDRFRPSESARRALLAGLRSVLPVATTIEVLDHVRGIRPASRDRLPLVGRHRVYPPLIMFNGFGSRGALEIPLAAKSLKRHIFDGESLPDHMALNRFPNST